MSTAKFAKLEVISSEMVGLAVQPPDWAAEFVCSGRLENCMLGLRGPVQGFRVLLALRV